MNNNIKKASSSDKIIIYTDGSTSPQSKNSGFSYKIMFPDKVVIGWGGIDNTHSYGINYIEMLAVEKALNTTLSYGYDLSHEKELFCDNLSVVESINRADSSKINPEAENPKNALLSQILRHNISGIHIKAHTSNCDEDSKGNQLCDGYANIGRLYGGFYQVEKKRISPSKETPVITVGISSNGSSMKFIVSIYDGHRTIEYKSTPNTLDDSFFQSLYKNIRKICRRYKAPFNNACLILFGNKSKPAFNVFSALLETEPNPNPKLMIFQGEGMEDYFLDSELYNAVNKSFKGDFYITRLTVFVEDLDFLD